MASTQPSQGVQTSTIILATIGTLTTAALAYAVYFDYRRRSDPSFRKSLKQQQKQVSRAAKEEAVAGEKAQKERIRQVVDEANEEGFPKDPEKTEEYFMTEVARGEGMCQDGKSSRNAKKRIGWDRATAPKGRRICLDVSHTDQQGATNQRDADAMDFLGSDPIDAALCFYKALKVYPQPRELINIYDKTVPKV